MSTLADQIAKLTNPAPEIVDPETDIYSETAAKLCDKSSLDNDLLEQVSTLRKKSTNLLDELDKKYAGKHLKKSDFNDYIGKASSTSDSDDNREDDIDELSDDEDVVKFSKSQGKLLSKEKYSFSESDFLESSGQKSELMDDDNDDDDSESENSEEEESEIEDDLNSTDGLVQNFSNIDVSNEIEKGKTIASQQEFWNRLCECRIKLQKLLVTANKLPQSDTWRFFRQASNATFKENANKSYKSVKVLLNNLLDLQEVFLNADTDFLSVNNSSIDTEKDDEEILSDSEDEKVVTPKQGKVKLGKRKLKEEEYSSFLAKRHKNLIPFRNSVIQKWDEKTRLSTGRMTQKSFSAFDQSALKQIEQILQDKNRLIKRTQLKRSIYAIVGKRGNESFDNADDELKTRNSNEILKDYDEEIFDDDDFYRLLLKDVIESKSVGIDPAILHKQQEIQRIRSKIRRKVDTKASKGRKIRYDVHPKLVNFMAPVVTCHLSDFARDNLYNSIFLPPGSTVKPT